MAAVIFASIVLVLLVAVKSAFVLLHKYDERKAKRLAVLMQRIHE
jgi:hypothetical protein